MVFKIKAVKDYKNAGYLRVDLDEGAAYLTPDIYRATSIPSREGAIQALDMLNTGTVEAREGMRFEIVTL